MGSALGGPFAGLATKYIADKFIGENSSTASGIEQQLVDLLEKPSNLQRLKELDTSFEREMRQLDIDVFEIEKERRKSGRDRANINNKPQIIISMKAIFLYFTLLFAMFLVETSDSLNMQKGENSLMGELQILLGVLTAGVGQILSYWFGGIMGRVSNPESQ